MRVLLDECLPRPLKRALVGYECKTAQESGWAGKKNGELLRLAEREFDVLLTVDHNIPHQHVFEGRDLALLVLRAASNKRSDILRLVPKILLALESIAPGQIVIVR